MLLANVKPANSRQHCHTIGPNHLIHHWVWAQTYQLKLFKMNFRETKNSESSCSERLYTMYLLFYCSFVKPSARVCLICQYMLIVNLRFCLFLSYIPSTIFCSILFLLFIFDWHAIIIDVSCCTIPPKTIPSLRTLSLWTAIKMILLLLNQFTWNKCLLYWKNKIYPEN